MATTTLGSKATGSIIKLKENGKLVEFYVGVHNYESSLNGTGRTLVFRKDCYDQRQWHTSNVNAYASSAIDSWLNSTYKNMLDADIRALIGSTKIRYTPGNGNTTMGTLDRAVFLLSAYELGKSESWFNKEGTTLPNATNYQIAKLNGSTVVQWDPLPEHELHQLRHLPVHQWQCLPLLLHQHPRVPPRFHSPLQPLCER